MSQKTPSAPSKDVIYVDVDDEITSIIDKVENSKHKVVALVLPKRAASLQSTVNMKLLKRSADTAEKSVVLITSEQALMPLAGAAGLHVAKNLQSAPEVPAAPSSAAPLVAADELPATEVPDGDEEDMPQKFDYNRPVGALAARHEAENPETIDLDDDDEPGPAKAAAAGAASKTPKNKIRVPDFDRFRLLLGLGGLALIALIVFIILALFVLPKAKITITTTSEPVSASFNLNASSGAAVDPAAGTIPAKLESMDQTGSQQVTATGQQNNGQKATGSIKLVNCSQDGSAADVPAGTGISANGVTYITQESANMPNSAYFGSCKSGIPNTSATVDITAQSAGSKYNGSISSGSVSGFPNVTANGSASGGTDNIVTVLSQSDVEGAQQKLTTSTNTNQFTQAFESKLSGQGEYVLTSTMKAGDPVITASPSVGQPASTANVTIKITYTVLTVQTSDLSQIIQAKTASQVDPTKQKLTGNFLNDASVTVQSQPSPNSAVLAVDENTAAVPIINIATVKKTAEGKKTGDIQTAINAWPGVKSVDVSLSPFWVSKVPTKDSKVTVVLKEDKSGSATSSAP